MRSFVDKNGQSWALELTIGQARKVFELGESESLVKLLDDVYARFDLLWILCEAQAKERRITVDQFDLALADETAMLASHVALIGCLQDFFQRIGKTSLSLLMTKSSEARKNLETAAQAKVATMDSALERVIAKTMTKLDQVIESAGS